MLELRMKYLILSLCFFSTAANAAYFGEQPSALAKNIRADKQEYFRAIGNWDKDSEEVEDALKIYLTGLVLCEVHSGYSDRECLTYRNNITSKVRVVERMGPMAEWGGLALPLFGTEWTARSRIILGAFTGFLRGVKVHGGAKAQIEATDLLATTGALVAKEIFFRQDLAGLNAQLSASKALTQEVRSGSMRSFGVFLEQFQAWLDSSREVNGVFVRAYDKDSLYYAPDLTPFTKVRDVAWGDARSLVLSEEGLHCVTNRKGAQCSVPEGVNGSSILQVSTYPEAGACALDAEGVFCWDHTVTYPTVRRIPNLVHPRSLSSSKDHACALDDEGVKCWAQGRINFPYPQQQQGLAMLASGNEFTCGLGAEKVLCWGGMRGQAIPKWNLWYPKHLRAVGTSACVTDHGGKKCWSFGRAGEETPPPGLRNVRLISAGNSFTCAVDDLGLHCWGNPFFYRTIPENFTDIRDLVTGSSFGCVISGTRILCWGGRPAIQSPPINMTNLRQLAADPTGETACALGEEGIMCWGEQSALISFQEVTEAVGDVRSISHGNSSVCALGSKGVNCWVIRRNEEGSQFLAFLSNPKFLFRDYAIDGDTIKGWDCSYGKCKLNPWLRDLPQNLRNPTAFAFPCWIDQGQVQCWGPNQPNTTFVNPRLITSGFDHSCAVDDQGVKCWRTKYPGQE